MAALFSLGSVVATPGALEKLDRTTINKALERHHQGDWGDVCDEDRKANDQSLRDGTRLLSVYHDSNQTKFWIITEADRSSTTILLPEEY